jgi:hypothetical protein
MAQFAMAVSQESAWGHSLRNDLAPPHNTAKRLHTTEPL